MRTQQGSESGICTEDEVSEHPPPVKVVVVVVVAMKCDIYTNHNEIMDAAREDCHTTTTTTTTTTTDHKLTIQ